MGRAGVLTSLVLAAALTAAVGSDGDTIPFRYEWQDFTPAVIGWDADTPVFDRSMVLPTLEVSGEIQRRRLRSMLDRYGFPEAWSEYSYRTEAERKAKVQDLTTRLARRGIRLTSEVCCDVNAVPDYDWIVRNSLEDVRGLASDIRDQVRDSGVPRHRRLLDVTSAFVQSMRYRIPPDLRTTPSGERVNTLGVALPIEMLESGRGDCDSKSLLFASILAQYPDERIVFLVGNDHMFVGVRAVPRPGDHYVKLRNVPYVLIEMTTPWPVGRLPQEVWKGYRANRFRVVRIR